MIKLVDIEKKFGDFICLQNINIEIDELDWLMISGESGSGKTTLLNIMTGLMKYDKGKVLYNGYSLNSKELDELRNNQFSIIFQNDNLIKEYNVYQNLLYTASYNNIDISKIDLILEKFDLLNLKNKYINQLSSGQKQKISIIKSILTPSSILFLDEPTGHLDDESTIEVMEIIKEINKERTIVMITHNQDLFRYANKVVEIENKQLRYLKNEKVENREIKVEKRKKRLSIKMMMDMAIWNIKYHLRTYILGIFTLSLTCMGLVFSNCMGNNINNDLKNILIQNDNEYELLITCNSVKNKEDVKKLAKNTNAIEYDLCLHTIASDINNIFINNKKNDVSIDKIKFKSNYEIKNHKNIFYISSSLYNKLKSNNKHISNIAIEAKILADYKEYTTMSWVTKELKYYIPLYQNEWIKIDDFDVVEEEQDVVYIDNNIYEKLIDKYNKKGSNSNQQIVNFKLKYDNYEYLTNAVERLNELEDYNSFSVYNDFHQIQETLNEQFIMFQYSSYILGIIAIIVIIFILFVLEQKKNIQYQQLYKQGINTNNQSIILIIEYGIIVIITIIISVIGLLILMRIFNNNYEVIQFLPKSVIDFINIYQLPVDNLKFFNVSIIYIIKLLNVVIIPIFFTVIIVSLLKRKNEFNKR